MRTIITLIIGIVIGGLWGFGLHGFMVANDRRRRIFPRARNINVIPAKVGIQEERINP